VNNILLDKSIRNSFNETNFIEIHYHLYSEDARLNACTHESGEVSEAEIEEIASNIKTYDDGPDIELPQRKGGESPDISRFDGASPPKPSGVKREKPKEKRTKFRILRFVKENPEASAKDIARALDMKENHLSAYLLNYTKQKLLEREKRVGLYRYRITDKGLGWLKWYEKRS